MKVLNFVLFVIILMSVSCKTQKIAPKPVPVKSETVVNPNQTVRSAEERISAANGEAKDLGSKKFYIILGSYKIYEGAQKFKKQLMAEDFFPGILINDLVFSHFYLRLTRLKPYLFENQDKSQKIVEKSL